MRGTMQAFMEKIENLIPFKQLNGRTVLITGATGMIGTCLVNLLRDRRRFGDDIRIVATSRSSRKIMEKFGDGIDCVEWDMHDDIGPKFDFKADYIVHLASNTHPSAYVDDAVGTIMMNIHATKVLLDFAVHCGARFVYASSVEVYGTNRGDTDLFNEDYCGYINCNTLRAGYPESKRCGEALCQAYSQKFGLDFVTARLARCYGPTLLKGDTKALSQFMLKAINGENIVLKSEGWQYFSYLHANDAASGILYAMLRGDKGEAYNIADDGSDIRLRDLAKIVADEAGSKVVFDCPTEAEKNGFSTATTARLDCTKIKSLGWRSMYDIVEGVSETLAALKENWK